MYIIRTSTDKNEIAQNIAQALVERHAAVSVHIREITSVYQWKGEIHNTPEWEIEAISSDPDPVKIVIMEYHNYELPEFIVAETHGSSEIELWCDEWCKQF